MTNLIDNLLIYPENMKKNLDLTKGLIFSQEVLLLLIKKGLTRENAYEVVQRNAMKVWKSDLARHGDVWARSRDLRPP